MESEDDKHLTEVYSASVERSDLHTEAQKHCELSHIESGGSKDDINCAEQEQEYELSHIESSVSKGELICVDQKQEYKQDSCKFLETPGEDAGSDDRSVINETDPLLQGMTDPACSDGYVEQDSECLLEPGDLPQNMSFRVLSNSGLVCDLDNDEQESKAVNSETDPERDLACTSRDQINNQQEQTSSILGLSDHVQPAVPHDDDIHASVPTENGISEIPEEQIDQTATNPVVGYGLLVHDDVSVSLNGPSASEHIVPLSVIESSANITSSSDMNSAQTVPEPSTGVADRREDQVPTTNVHPDEPGQGHSELCVVSVRSVTHNFLSEDSVGIDNSAAMEGEIQPSHSSTSSFVPTERAHKESDMTVSNSALSSVRIKEEPGDTGYEQAQTQSEQSISVSENSKVGDSNRSDVTTTITKQGKKRRVRIVVVKGEWRKPKTKVKNKNLINSVGQDPRQNALSQTQRPSSTVSPVPTSSAIPTALFRNVHIKTEPVDGGYPEKQLTSDSQLSPVPLSSTSSQPEAVSESGSTSQHKFPEIPVRLTEACTRSSVISSCLFSQRADQRERGRGRGQTSSSSTSWGQTSSSRTSRGQTSSSRTSQGRTSSSGMLWGQTSSSRTSQGQTSSSGTSQGQISSRRTSQGQTSSGGTSWGQTSSSRTSQGKTSSSRTSSASEASEELEATPEKTALESRIQSCGVILRRLPSHIETAGVVNLKTESQILQDAAILAVSSRLCKQPRDSKRPWECELCDKTYKTKSARTQHYKIHLGLREHVCTICSADFAYKSVLTSHYRFVHLKEKPHVCPVCGKRFGWSSHLGVHLNRHYEDKPYTCPICHQDFNSFYIKKHLETHSEVRAFKCTICKGKYRSKRGLQEHMKVHSGIKPFRCDTCGQQFPYSNSLASHMRTHTGERPFACPKCPSTFTQSSHLRTHLKGVHKVKTFPSNRRKELVQRVFPRPPAHISKDHFQLMRHALSQASLLEKKVLEKKQIKSGVVAEVSTENGNVANNFEPIQESRNEHSGKVRIRPGRKRGRRGGKGCHDKKSAETEEPVALTCNDDMNPNGSGSTAIHAPSTCHESEVDSDEAEEIESGSTKRAKIQEDNDEGCDDDVETVESDDDILEPGPTPTGCVVKSNFRPGEGEKGLAEKL